jgi:hypothetical protein
MGKEEEIKNWRAITVTSCVYRLFTAMITQWIQDQHAQNKLLIFSRAQKGFVQGQACYMEHTILTREMPSPVQVHRKNLYTVQIDLSNASSSVPHDLILLNTTAMGIPPTVTEIVKNIYTDNGSKISLVGSDTGFSPWASGTVQWARFRGRCSISVWRVSCAGLRSPICFRFATVLNLSTVKRFESMLLRMPMT